MHGAGDEPVQGLVAFALSLDRLKRQRARGVDISVSTLGKRG
jgi:hypothetical protein